MPLVPPPWPADMDSFIVENRKDEVFVFRILNAMAATIVNCPLPLRLLSVQEPYEIYPTTYVRAFGCFGMGVLKRDDMCDDISVSGTLDVLMILPKHVRRESIFQTFERMLRQQGNFDEIVSIEQAHGPAIKFSYHDVDVNLVFAVLQLDFVPSSDHALLEETILKGMDMSSQRSFNGWRVRKYLLDYVPDVYLFRNVLAEIWLWARNRLIDSTNCGYLGGTAWAIMVAKVCDMHRDDSMTTCRLIVAFFEEYANWNWSSSVIIAEEVDGANFENQHMSVISPVSPHQNCAYSVTRTTFDFIKDALKDTHESLQGIRDMETVRDVLAVKMDPSVLYKSFVGIVARVTQRGRLKAWRGAVEFQFVELNKEFEQDHETCSRAQIFPECYVSRDCLQCTWIIGVDFVGGTDAVPFLSHFERFRQNLYVRHQVCTSGPHHGNTLSFHCWTKSNVDFLLR